MMRARAAVAADCAGVVASALQFDAYTPSPENVEALFDLAMSCGGMFVAVDDDDLVLGFLCAVKQPHVFTGRDHVTVVAWWVPPEHRATGAGLALLRAWLRWISTQALDMVTISTPLSSHLGTILQSAGFSPVETVWMRGVTWP